MKEYIGKVKRHVLTGTSHMIPFIVAGGILYSCAVMFNPAGAVEPESGFLHAVVQIGLAGFRLYIPILGGYIAYSIAKKPGLVPGMIGAYLAQSIGAGFLGGMIAGMIAGITMRRLKRIPFSDKIKSVVEPYLYPLLGTLITGGMILGGIGVPVAKVMNGLTKWLAGLGGIGKMPLAAILGSMTAFDMGGPVNKIATLFAQTQVDTLPYLMGGVGVAIATPAIGMGIATILAPKKYTEEERQAGKASILMGSIGITEGAIPFAANDPIRVIPSIIVGAAAGNIMAFSADVLNHAPWGGIIVLPVVEERFMYVMSLFTGSMITALMVNCLKKDIKTKKQEKIEEIQDIELNFEEF